MLELDSRTRANESGHGSEGGGGGGEREVNFVR